MAPYTRGRKKIQSVKSMGCIVLFWRVHSLVQCMQYKMRPILKRK